MVNQSDKVKLFQKNTRFLCMILYKPFAVCPKNLQLVVAVTIFVTVCVAHPTSPRPRSTTALPTTTLAAKLTVVEAKRENRVLRYDVRQTDAGSKFVYVLKTN